MKEFKHLPGLDLIRVFGILVVVFYHYQVETAVRGLCPADFLPAMEPLVQVAVYTMTLLSGSCLCWQEKSRSWSMKRYLWGRFLAIYPLFWLCFFPIFIYSDIICGNNEGSSSVETASLYSGSRWIFSVFHAYVLQNWRVVFGLYSVPLRCFSCTLAHDSTPGSCFLPP